MAKLIFSSILLFSENPKELSEFYEKVLEIKPNQVQDDYYGFLTGGISLIIGPHNKVKGNNKEPERIMINFQTEDVAGEFERIERINGAAVIAKPYSMDGTDEAQIATFEDPDGNYFQLMIPFETDLSKN